jgi:hypothetical protein
MNAVTAKPVLIITQIIVIDLHHICMPWRSLGVFWISWAICCVSCILYRVHANGNILFL